MASTKLNFFFVFALLGRCLFENKHPAILSASLKRSFGIVPMTSVWTGIWQSGLIRKPNSAKVKPWCAPWSSHLELTGFTQLSPMHMYTGKLRGSRYAGRYWKTSHSRTFPVPTPTPQRLCSSQITARQAESQFRKKKKRGEKCFFTLFAPGIGLLQAEECQSLSSSCTSGAAGAPLPALAAAGH